MTKTDMRRWDEKYASMTGPPLEPHPLLIKSKPHLTGGQALDLACGRGQNAIFLAQQGYSVSAVDISLVALTGARIHAQKAGVAGSTTFIQADLDEWPIKAQSYDLVCVFRFLERQLLPTIRRAIRPGGLMIYSTRHLGVLSHSPGANPAFLLESGELKAVASGWHVLAYHEGVENADLIARKPETES